MGLFDSVTDANSSATPNIQQNASAAGQIGAPGAAPVAGTSPPAAPADGSSNPSDIVARAQALMKQGLISADQYTKMVATGSPFAAAAQPTTPAQTTGTPPAGAPVLAQPSAPDAPAAVQTPSTQAPQFGAPSPSLLAQQPQIWGSKPQTIAGSIQS